MPPVPSLKEKIKTTLAGVGKVLAGKDSKRRLTVLRCSNQEQVQTALRLFAKAYPKLQWEHIAVHETDPQQAIAHAIALYTQGTKRIPILYEFPGEEKGHPADPGEISRFGRVAAAQQLVDYPVVLVILASSVGAFVKGASELWKGKGGYFAWPTPPPIFEEETPGSDEAGFITSDAELQEVLKSLSGDAAAEYLLRIAEHHITQREWEKARLFLIRAVQIFSQGGNLQGMAKGYHLLGTQSASRGDLNGALEWYDQAVDNWRVMDDMAQLAVTTTQKGHVLYLKGQLDRAARAFREATDIYQESGNESGVSAGHRQMAMVLERLGKSSAAEKLYTQSMEMEEAAGRRGGVARCKIHVGRILDQRGDLTKARQYFEEGLAIHRELDDKPGIATAQHHLGNVLFESKETAEAVAAYEEAVALEKELRDYSGLSRTNAELAAALVKLGREPEALHALVMAHYLASKLRTGLVATLTERVAELEDSMPADEYNRILQEATTQARDLFTHNSAGS